MRLAIFGVPRSGTSLLFQTIKPNFTHWVNEPFPPASNNRIIEIDGHLRNQYSEKDDTGVVEQSRDERLLLFKKYPEHDYFIKVFPHDVRYLPVFDWLMEREYRFIAIERRRPIDAVISVIIANKTRKWIYRPDEDIPEIEPIWFDSNYIGQYIIDAYRIYYEFADKGPSESIHKRVFYEDISNMTTSHEIFEAVGLSDLIDYLVSDDKMLPLRKPLTEEDKRKLITNMPELVDWYQEKLVPILPDRAKQFDLDEYL